MLRKFQDEYGVEVLHAWGMTELSPLGTVGAMPLGATGKVLKNQLREKFQDHLLAL